MSHDWLHEDDAGGVTWGEPYVDDRGNIVQKGSNGQIRVIDAAPAARAGSTPSINITNPGSVPAAWSTIYDEQGYGWSYNELTGDVKPIMLNGVQVRKAQAPADVAPGPGQPGDNGLNPRTGLPWYVVPDKNSPSGYTYTQTGQAVYQDGTPYSGAGSDTGVPEPPAGPTYKGTPYVWDSTLGQYMPAPGIPIQPTDSTAPANSRTFSGGGGGGDPVLTAIINANSRAASDAAAAARQAQAAQDNMALQGARFGHESAEAERAREFAREMQEKADALRIALERPGYEIAKRQFERQLLQDRLTAARTVGELTSSTDPGAMAGFLAAGGGNIANAIAGGATAVTDKANLGAARALQAAEAPIEGLPEWESYFGGDGGTFANASATGMNPADYRRWEASGFSAAILNQIRANPTPTAGTATPQLGNEAGTQLPTQRWHTWNGGMIGSGWIGGGGEDADDSAPVEVRPNYTRMPVQSGGSFDLDGQGNYYQWDLGPRFGFEGGIESAPAPLGQVRPVDQLGSGRTLTARDPNTGQPIQIPASIATATFPAGNPAGIPAGSRVSRASVNAVRANNGLPALAHGGMTTARLGLVDDAPAPNPFAGPANPEVFVNPTGAPVGFVPLRQLGNSSQSFPAAMPRYAFGTLGQNVASGGFNQMRRQMAAQSSDNWDGPRNGLGQPIDAQGNVITMGTKPAPTDTGNATPGVNDPVTGTAPSTGGATLPGDIINESDRPFLERIGAIRAGVQYPQLNPYAADFFANDPTVMETFLRGQQTKYGIPVVSTLFDARRNQPLGFSRGQLRLGL